MGGYASIQFTSILFGGSVSPARPGRGPLGWKAVDVPASAPTRLCVPPDTLPLPQRSLLCVLGSQFTSLSLNTLTSKMRGFQQVGILFTACTWKFQSIFGCDCSGGRSNECSSLGLSSCWTRERERAEGSADEPSPVSLPDTASKTWRVTGLGLVPWDPCLQLSEAWLGGWLRAESGSGPEEGVALPLPGFPAASQAPLQVLDGLMEAPSPVPSSISWPGPLWPLASWLCPLCAPPRSLLWTSKPPERGGEEATWRRQLVL